MPRKKEVEEQGEELEEEEELENFDLEEVAEPSPEDLIRKDIEKLMEVKRKLVEAVKVNQKYIKRNFQSIKDLEDNFNILLDKSK